MKGSALAAALLLALAGRALAAVSVTTSDGSAALAEIAPASGAESATRSVADPLTFTNAGATERQLLVLSAAGTLAADAGSTSAGSASFQGTTVALGDLLYAASSAGGAFLPLRVTTSTDLTGEAGWTKGSPCSTVNYQGSLSIPRYGNDGFAQAPLVRYYQVCDATRIWVDADKDLSNGDVALVSTAESSVLSTGEADYEVSIQSTDYVFASAASATTVTLQRGHYLSSPLLASPTSVDVYPLVRFPDGFPAGVLNLTVTATGLDISQ